MPVKKHFLTKWMFKFPERKAAEFSVFVFGMNKENLRESKISSCIVKRSTETVLKSDTGDIYVLCGEIDEFVGKILGYPESLMSQFRSGFPKHWKKLLSSFYKEEYKEQRDFSFYNELVHLGSTISASFASRTVSSQITNVPSPIPKESHKELTKCSNNFDLGNATANRFFSNEYRERKTSTPLTNVKNTQPKRFGGQFFPKKLQSIKPTPLKLPPKKKADRSALVEASPPKQNSPLRELSVYDFLTEGDDDLTPVATISKKPRTSGNTLKPAAVRLFSTDDVQPTEKADIQMNLNNNNNNSDSDNKRKRTVTNEPEKSSLPEKSNEPSLNDKPKKTTEQKLQKTRVGRAVKPVVNSRSSETTLKPAAVRLFSTDDVQSTEKADSQMNLNNNNNNNKRKRTVTNDPEKSGLPKKPAKPTLADEPTKYTEYKLQTTRFGRVVKPPLAYWAGQRISYDVEGNPASYNNGEQSPVCFLMSALQPTVDLTPLALLLNLTKETTLVEKEVKRNQSVEKTEKSNKSTKIKTEKVTKTVISSPSKQNQLKGQLKKVSWSEEDKELLKRTLISKWPIGISEWEKLAKSLSYQRSASAVRGFAKTHYLNLKNSTSNKLPVEENQIVATVKTRKEPSRKALPNKPPVEESPIVTEGNTKQEKKKELRENETSVKESVTAPASGAKVTSIKESVTGAKETSVTEPVPGAKLRKQKLSTLKQTQQEKNALKLAAVDDDDDGDIFRYMKSDFRILPIAVNLRADNLSTTTTPHSMAGLSRFYDRNISEAVTPDTSIAPATPILSKSALRKKTVQYVHGIQKAKKPTKSNVLRNEPKSGKPPTSKQKKTDCDKVVSSLLKDVEQKKTKRLCESDLEYSSFVDDYFEPDSD